jgi:hypothetical protein
MSKELQEQIDEIKNRIEEFEASKQIYITKYDNLINSLTQDIKEIEEENIRQNGLEFMYAKCGQFFSPNKVLRLAEIDGKEVIGAFGKREHHSIIKNISGINLAVFKLDQEKLDKIGHIISRSEVQLKIWKDGKIEVA